MGGEFTTERGCTIKVIPPGFYNPERTTLAFSMDHPEDIRTGEILLTEEELEKLRRILIMDKANPLPVSTEKEGIVSAASEGPLSDKKNKGE